MHEILSRLKAGQRVLDLGASHGSFPAELTLAQVVRLDLEAIARTDAPRVAAVAERLPFAGQSFDAVIANHSLEHVADLNATLREIGRVLKPAGMFYAAVPDASTLADKLYKWLARGGGHVNSITDAEEFIRQVERESGLRIHTTRLLYSGFTFLHPANLDRRPPGRIWLLGGPSLSRLWLAVRLLRWIDRRWGTRLSVYGWAFWAGPVGCISMKAVQQVCLRCGSSMQGEFQPECWTCEKFSVE